jgi:hypothetical protein
VATLGVDVVAVTRAAQLSARGGELFCQLRGDRVLMSGHAVQYSEGRIRLPPL